MLGSYWLLVKSVPFHRLEYTTDLFTNLGLTRSFFEGRPLLWENGYGDHKAFHNFYIAVLLYPFTRFLGAYGLFVAQALLSGWAVHNILRRARDARRVEARPLLGDRGRDGPGSGRFLFLGQLGLWLSFRAPFRAALGAVRAESLEALKVSVDLRGADRLDPRGRGVLAWCIQVLYEVLNAEDGDRKARSALFRRLAWTTLGWLVVFIAGMGLLLAMERAVTAVSVLRPPPSSG